MIAWSPTAPVHFGHTQARPVLRAIFRGRAATRLIAAGVSGAISAVFGSGSSQPSATALSDIPADYQPGKPYVWGGNGDPGFDCSGLTRAAYAAAGVGIPRTAQTQYSSGRLLPTGTRLRPGDLVFYGTGPDSVTHVGVAISAMQMIDAPHTVADVRTDGVGRYLAASRPAATTP